MNKISLAPKRPRVKQDVTVWGKSKAVPNQSMTLQEIIKRFIKRESLPTEKQGVYVETDYDLEKLSKEDQTIQDEVLEEMKVRTETLKKEVERKRKVKADMDAAAKEPVKQKDPKEEKPPKKDSPPEA